MGDEHTILIYGRR